MAILKKGVSGVSGVSPPLTICPNKESVKHLPAGKGVSETPFEPKSALRGPQIGISRPKIEFSGFIFDFSAGNSKKLSH
jgi:hypothetical protein